MRVELQEISKVIMGQSPKGESYIQSNNTSYRGQEVASPVATRPQPTRRLLDD